MTQKGAFPAVDPDPLTVPEDSTWAAESSEAPVRHALLLAAVITLLPVAVVCLFILDRARDVLRALVGRLPRD